MAEQKNSKTLDIVIRHARSAGGSETAALTIERFVWAVLDIGYSAGGNVPDELYTLSRSIPVADADTAMTRLLEHIKASGATAFIDGLMMQKIMITARQRTPDGEALSAVTVMNCIMADGMTDALHDVMAPDSLIPPASGGNARREEKLFDECYQDDLHRAEKALEKQELEKNPKLRISRLIERVKNAQRELLDRVYGQDKAVNVFTEGYFQAEMLALTDPTRQRPRATFLFAGPPGVGKTLLAETAAKILDLPFMRFDMSEYSDKEACFEFSGSDNVYKNAKAGNVTGFVAEHPECVLLFDEIEKAHLNVIHLFLQILDAGRLRDSYTDHEVSFSDTILIFTTNAGRQLYDTPGSGDFSGLSRKVILKALQRDVDPTTGSPYFPGAICSRFASGNVVMFNSIAAHDLRNIARRAVLRRVRAFTGKTGIEVDIDERVYTALLFAEGGSADARTVRSRAESFFDGELFELFRLIASDKVSTGLEELERIRIDVRLPEDAGIVTLFERTVRPEVLLLASKETADACRNCAPEADIYDAQSVEQAKLLLLKNDIYTIVIDPSFGQRDSHGYLNLEDADSVARDFFLFARATYEETPVYILQREGVSINDEEKVSFFGSGVRGIITLDRDTIAQQLRDVCRNLHWQRSMIDIAKANKVVNFGSSQTVSADGKFAGIQLFDFRMALAVEAEDSEHIASGSVRTDVRFENVIGADDAKRELKYFVEFLKDPRHYLGRGMRAPRGVLLYGPPGTGKTMLARAMANEAGVTFISAEGNQFLKKYVGEGPEKIHELFRTARKYAPSVVFIDEIDAIAKERRGGENSSAAEQTLTALLTEMDGFRSDATKPVFVLAATNFEVEQGSGRSLDAALLRRFDRRIYIELPDRDDRMKYMRQSLGGNALFDVSAEKLENLAMRSAGMSLADLESVFDLALRSMIRDGGERVTDEALEEAFETFNNGERKMWDVSQLERVARHEAGHAFLCWYGGDTPSYVTVVARADHGGYMQNSDHDGKNIYTRREMLSMIRTDLGGRAAEIAYYGPEDGISTGASGDLRLATAHARQMLCSYGMDDDFGLSVITPQGMSEGVLSSDVRDAVNRLLAEQLNRAVDIVTANRDVMDILSAALLERNHMSGVELDELLMPYAGRRGVN